MRLRLVLPAAATAAVTASALLIPVLPSVAAEAEGRPGSHRTIEPTLVARATLSADFVAPGPPSGALATPANGREGPFPGQVIPGFSAAIDNGDGTFWALPDNGFGSKTNSADFLLRLYHVMPQWETGDGGSSELEIGEFISLRDPDGHIDFEIINGETTERLLTGGDFDVESVVRAADGSFWIGEEFGPFLLHVDATGALLQAPVPLPGVMSPQNPYLQPGQEPTLGASRGFEAMAGSRDGRFLYPIIEGALRGETDQRRRVINEFDTRQNRYTGRTWDYQVDTDANLVADAFMTGPRSMLIVERDDFDGPASVTKRIYAIDLKGGPGYVEKSLVVDVLKVANPHLIGDGDGYGTGDPWSLPVQSFETVVQLADGNLLIGNDNNYPGNDARIPGTPDDTEMAIIELRTVTREPNAAVVIGHRGASGYRPEHTLAAYEQAILQCADVIEPDLVSTSDGVLVARHENEISGTTNVADHPEFADRRTTKVIDGVSITGWFTEDFTLAELRTLRAKERIPATRPENTAFDGLYPIPTLDEVLDLARNSRTCDGGEVGVYPETKHPTYFDSIGLSLEEPLIEVLRANGMDGAGDRVVVQSFEVGNLQDLARMSRVQLVQLINCSGAPYDFIESGDPRTYRDMVTPDGMREIAEYADAVSFCKDVMIPRNPDGTLGEPTGVIDDAHDVGLTAVGWTFRRENQFLPVEFRSSSDPNEPGDMAGEVRAFLDAGMDEFFTDNPDVGVEAVN